MRFVFPLLLGLAGCAVLIGLGLWQVQRLEWKTAILADIDSRIGAAPVAVPAAPDPVEDRFLPVRASGEIAGPGLRVLTSPEGLSAGYRRIVPFETDGRRLLLDAGWVPLDDPAPLEGAALELVGNLHWPDETDSFTPAPEGDLWFVRDVAAMAEALDTEPVLIVLREPDRDLGTVPLPLDSAGIANDHLEYAITWFLLALVWAGMTGYLIVRTMRRREG
ncbi:SURF1 family protein [Oceanicola granulosus HTCC2516]|uniref:SURF1-like protein n=1 Tax=Oceanicola granulosus (strain ATCC BAA-861 / DSM 15982 / KCTC 12143 / HTCC2516) TaxID=314256 RepID=Q2CAD1_OCEGH|nr:SURF1 family protein [Oceanicola granulosus]EAR49636.1 SURF1 family protein [Oceanicola granulosus HTCC2516]